MKWLKYCLNVDLHHNHGFSVHVLVTNRRFFKFTLAKPVEGCIKHSKIFTHEPLCKTGINF